VSTYSTESAAAVRFYFTRLRCEQSMSQPPGRTSTCSRARRRGSTRDSPASQKATAARAEVCVFPFWRTGAKVRVYDRPIESCAAVSSSWYKAWNIGSWIHQHRGSKPKTAAYFSFPHIGVMPEGMRFLVELGTRSFQARQRSRVVRPWGIRPPSRRTGPAGRANRAERARAAARKRLSPMQPGTWWWGIETSPSGISEAAGGRCS
jgi:hypothetical protein